MCMEIVWWEEACGCAVRGVCTVWRAEHQLFFNKLTVSIMSLTCWQYKNPTAERTRDTGSHITQPTAWLLAALHRSSYINACNNVFPPPRSPYPRTHKKARTIALQTHHETKSMHDSRVKNTLLLHFLTFTLNLFLSSCLLPTNPF